MGRSRINLCLFLDTFFFSKLQLAFFLMMRALLIFSTKRTEFRTQILRLAFKVTNLYIILELCVSQCVFL